MCKTNNKHNAQKSLRAVIFDLDGTLLYTLENLCESVNYALSTYNLPIRTLEEIRTFVGNGVSKLMERAIYSSALDIGNNSNILFDDKSSSVLKNDLLLNDKLFTNTNITSCQNTEFTKTLNKHNFQACLNLFKEHYTKTMYEKTRPYEGVETMLKELCKHGIKCTVVSNKFDTAVKELCYKYFGDLICCAIGESNEIRKKPQPDGVFKAIRFINDSNYSSKQSIPTQAIDTVSLSQVDTEGIIYVGDSEVDIETARNADLPCISVSWGYKDRDFLISFGAKNIVDTPQELANVLLNHVIK